MVEDENVADLLNPKIEKPKKYSKKVDPVKEDGATIENGTDAKRTRVKKRKSKDQLEAQKENKLPPVISTVKTAENNRIGNVSEVMNNERPARTKKLIPDPSLIRIKGIGSGRKIILKKGLYKTIRKQILNSNWKWMRRRSLKQRRPETIAQTAIPETEKNPRFVDEPKQLELTEMLPNPLSNSDLSNDIFAFQVPAGTNNGSLSPTEAFLLSFPVVTPSVGGGKNSDNASKEELRLNEPMNTNHLNLDNFFNPKDDFLPILFKSTEKNADKSNNLYNFDGFSGSLNPEKPEIIMPFRCSMSQCRTRRSPSHSL